MKKTLIWLLLIGAFCVMIGELVFVLMPRQMAKSQAEEIELPAIHFRTKP